jgi:hypothetical protein
MEGHYDRSDGPEFPYLSADRESPNFEFPRLPKPWLARGGQGKNKSQISNIKFKKVHPPKL